MPAGIDWKAHKNLRSSLKLPSRLMECSSTFPCPLQQSLRSFPGRMAAMMQVPPVMQVPGGRPAQPPNKLTEYGQAAFCEVTSGNKAVNCCKILR